MGLDYVLDLIGELEVAPTFPVGKSFSLATKASQLKSRRHNLNPDNINYHKFDFSNNWRFHDTSQLSVSSDASVARASLAHAIKGNEYAAGMGAEIAANPLGRPG